MYMHNVCVLMSRDGEFLSFAPEWFKGDEAVNYFKTYSSDSGEVFSVRISREMAADITKEKIRSKATSMLKMFAHSLTKVGDV